ncbi:MAG TPA: fibronectin type III domain-containing protein [Acidobacteriaceae bacterium]|nr:fibronectin type III domain-containing protein [Acidobacteriaceae bacterium]
MAPIQQKLATIGFAGISAASTALLTGCGMAAAPQPPSLHLPRQVKNLEATRSGNYVKLGWDTPKETTDKLKLTGPVRFRICREQGKSGCSNIATAGGVPGRAASYTDHLTAALASGPLRSTTYEVYGLNQRDRSAGPSNAAAALLGAAPPAVAGLAAGMSERGVVLRWQTASPLPAGTEIHLHRTLIVPPRGARASSANLPVAEPEEQTLAVTLDGAGKDPGVALDPGVEFDRTYRYTAIRVVKLTVDKQSLQAASARSKPVEITTRDTFPPKAPEGLVAVPVSAAINGGQPEVDLSWVPNRETDLAQYRVYRREIGRLQACNTPPQEIAPEEGSELLIAPAFRDVHVQPGHIYAYSVRAVDTAGNQSAPSAEVQVTLPGK